jgi:hypothetical protein
MTLDDVRTAVAKCEAIANAAEELFDVTAWGADADRQRLERLAHLIGAAAESAMAALVACDRLAGVLADTSPATAADRW